MEEKTKLFSRLGCIYIILPLIIFFAGFLNLPAAVISCTAVLAASYFLFKDAPGLWKPQGRKEYLLLACAAAAALIWVCTSGIGALMYQNFDHEYRNLVFEVLIEHKWPVFTGDGAAFLSYYIGFWMPSALIGKIFNSISIGYYAQVIWAALGVFLVFYFILASLKKKSFMPLMLFILFSGLDIIGIYLIAGRLKDGFGMHIEWWTGYWQFSSFTTQLYWVFNQALYAWLLTLILYNEKTNKNMIFLYASLFIYAPIPALGLFPFLLYFMIKNSGFGFKLIKSLFTIQNIIGVSAVFPIIYFYLSNNISGGKFHIAVPIFLPAVILFLLFFMLEAGIYLLLLFKQNKNSPLWYISLLCLFICPFLYIGSAKDFSMRASIPALLMIYLMTAQAFQNEDFLKQKVCRFLLISALILGSAAPVCEIYRSFSSTQKGIIKADIDKADLKLYFNNFHSYSKNSIFVKYLAKRNQK